MTDKTTCPKKSLIRKWAKQVLQKTISAAEVTIRIVDPEEMTALNFTYRQKNKPTNVLSFPLSLPEDIQLETQILGDIIICAEIVNQEAREQNKLTEAHWAHMITHGILHLQGHDHEADDEAEKMESLEIKIMQALGFNNPYESRIHDER